MANVFISYKAEEYDEAVWVKKILEENRITCWMAPQSIPTGSSYAKEIDSAIKNCNVVVLMLSRAAQDSVWIEKEIDIALNYRKIIVPFDIEDCPIQGAFNFYLTNVQRCYAYLDKARAIEEVVTRIRSVIGSDIGRPISGVSNSVGKKKFNNRDSGDDTPSGKKKTVKVAEGKQIYDDDSFKLKDTKAPGVETKKYNGGEYTGYMQNGLRHGKGIYRFDSGATYNGGWKNGKFHGVGEYKFPNGDVYVGEWFEDQKHGKGRYTWESGTVYEGDWKNGVRTGYGTNTWPDGGVYVGQWVNNKMSGKGTHYLASGAVYDGDWENDQKNGQGEYRFANGDVYTGGWVNSKKQGHGVYRWAGGDVFDGEWFEDKRHGYGVYTWADGSTQKGRWENGTYVKE